MVIPTHNASATIAGCLESVLANSCPGAFEVIVIDSSADGTAEVVASRFPAVRLHRSRRRLFPGDARNVGVAHARGRILAFTDADCVVSPRWLQAISEAHAHPAPAFGGVVENANPAIYVGWASYFCKFAPWSPPTKTGTMVEIPTCCLSIKRWAFDAYGPFREGTLSSDTAFSWRLGSAGQRPRLSPSIRVSHINRGRAGAFLSNMLCHGRDFAAVRVAERQLSTLRRLALAVGCPLLPGLLFARTAARVLTRRRYAARFLTSAPLVAIGHAAWSAGELRGYLRPHARPVPQGPHSSASPASPQSVR